MLRQPAARQGAGFAHTKFGHRGVNQPVKDVTTGKVEITAHNHGLRLMPIGEWCAIRQRQVQVFVSHVDLNDNVVEGLQCVDIPAFSVHNTEVAAGPHDAAYLFDRFVEPAFRQEENAHA